MRSAPAFTCRRLRSSDGPRIRSRSSKLRSLNPVIHRSNASWSVGSTPSAIISATSRLPGLNRSTSVMAVSNSARASSTRRARRSPVPSDRSRSLERKRRNAANPSMNSPPSLGPSSTLAGKILKSRTCTSSIDHAVRSLPRYCHLYSRTSRAAQPSLLAVAASKRRTRSSRAGSNSPSCSGSNRSPTAQNYRSP